MNKNNNRKPNKEPFLRIPLYKSHEGTLRISGATTPNSAGVRAFHYLMEGVTSIEFFVIGGNANYVAMKAMAIFLFKVEEATKGETTVSFQPRRYRTVVNDGDGILMDCTVWSTVVHTKIENKNDPKEPEGNGKSGDSRNTKL